MSRTTLGSQILWATRRPRAALSVARHRPLWLFLMVARGLPATLGRILLGSIAREAGRRARRPGDHPTAGPVAVAALAILDRRDAAAEMALRLAPAARAVTAGRLAEVAVFMGEMRLADELISPHRQSLESAGRHGMMLDEIDYRMGRYTEAARRLDDALARRPDDRELLARAERAQAQLALLDPAWRPLGAGWAPGRPTPRVAGRILHLLTNSLPQRPAGYTVRAQQVARCQLDVGLDPRMVTRAGFPGGDRAAPFDEIEGIRYRRIEPRLPRGVSIDRIAQATADGLLELVHELQPAVLHPATNYVNAQVALAVGERVSLPVVYEVRGFLEESLRAVMGETVVSGDRYRSARDVETACMRRATAVVTLSETMKEDILGRGGVDPDRVVVVPNGVDVDRFVPGPRDDALASSLGIGDEVVVGYISSLVAYEGIDTLIAAVARLRERGRRVRLLIVGDGEVGRTLRATARRLGLVDDGTAIFTGRVPHAEVDRYYRTIDVFVVPRTNDRVSQLVTPLKPYEAMSMEKALVVSGVPALLEIVREGETGRSFTPEDPDALADVLDDLIGDAGQRRRLGEAARAWVAENRTWAMNGQRYLDLYRRLGVA